MLGDDEIGDILHFGIVRLVVTWAVNKRHDVGVLLDGTRFTEVGEHRNRRRARFDRTRELTQGNQRHVEFACDELESAGDFRDFLDAVTIMISCGLHELQVVDDDQSERLVMCSAAGFGTHLEHRKSRRVIDKNWRLCHLPHRLG